MLSSDISSSGWMESRKKVNRKSRMYTGGKARDHDRTHAARWFSQNEALGYKYDDKMNANPYRLWILFVYKNSYCFLWNVKWMLTVH